MILLLSYSLFLLKGEWMKKDRFHLYHIDMKYIRDLAKADDNVMSISPQIGKIQDHLWELSYCVRVSVIACL